MNTFLKFGIIALAWIVYMVIAFSGGDNQVDHTAPVNEPVSETSVASGDGYQETPDTNLDVIELVAGEVGEYGKEIIMSKGTDMEEKLIVYYVPAGKYSVKNLGENPTQVSVYEGFSKNNNTGYDEYTGVGDLLSLDVNGQGQLQILSGWFIEIHEPAHISLTAM